LRLTIGTVRSEISTGFFIKSPDWNARTHRLKKSSIQAKEINEYLQAALVRINEIQPQLTVEDKPVTPAAIKNRLRNKDKVKITLMNAIRFHNDLMKNGTGKNYAFGTYKGYIWFEDKVKSFLSHQYRRTDIRMSELSPFPY